jgi:hypothetical protein
MKKVSLLIALCAALMIAAPAMALDVEVSGHYFIEYYNHSNQTLSADTARNDFSTMEFMAKPVFKINENITLTTQFTALEGHVWGVDAGDMDYSALGKYNGMDDENNFEWKAAYLTIKTPIGGFIAGRYIDTPWGTGFADSTSSHGSNSIHKDRVMYVLPIGNTISGLVYQKEGEYDKDVEYTDEDNFKAYGFTSYKEENWSTGLLVANYTYKSFTSPEILNAAYNNGFQAGVYAQMAQLDPATYGPLAQAAGAQAQSAQASAGTAKLDLWVFLPYFKGEFGNFGIETEFAYGVGEIDQGDYTYTEDTDVEALGYMFDLSYDFGPVSFMAGTTYIQGDTDFDDDKTGSFAFLERNIDHERGFLLTSDTAGLETVLGGAVEQDPTNLTSVAGMTSMGNLSSRTGVTALAGAQMFYFDIGWQATETLELGLFVVKSNADEPPKTATGAEWDDDHGMEYDLTVSWDIMDNLNFTGILAHLDAGDFWKQGIDDKKVENNTTLYGCLTVEF